MVRGIDLFANRVKLSLFFSLLRMFRATMLDAVPIGVAIPPIPVPTASAQANGAMSTFQGVSIAPLAWALAVGTGIGGMATPIGTASNMVALNILNKEKKRLSFSRFAKRSVPLTIIDLLIANIILLVRL